LGEQCVRIAAQLPTATLEQLLARPDWRPLSCRPKPDWRLSTPLVLGRAALTMDQLKPLLLGKVVLPEQSLFQPDGNGSLLLGRQRLRGRLSLPRSELRAWARARYSASARARPASPRSATMTVRWLMGNWSTWMAT
jgi:hypothetical protein